MTLTLAQLRLGEHTERKHMESYVRQYGKIIARELYKHASHGDIAATMSNLEGLFFIVESEWRKDNPEACIPESNKEAHMLVAGILLDSTVASELDACQVVADLCKSNPKLMDGICVLHESLATPQALMKGLKSDDLLKFMARVEGCYRLIREFECEFL